MREIISVTGKIEPSDIRFCQFHEHLLIRKGKSYQIHPALWMEDVDASAREAAGYKRAGGTTLIDAQPGGCGRMAEGLAEIAKASGVHIICSTGFHKMQFYPRDHWIFRTGEKELEEFFVRELTEGVDRHCETVISGETGEQKAGIIKCALDTENLSPQYRRLFLACAKASVNTGRSMMVHIEKGSDPVLLLEYLLNLGMNPKHLIFCHMDRAVADLDIHRKILKAGVYLEFDTIGRYKYHSDEQEASIFRTLIDDGYEDQLLFSLDTTRERLKSYDPKGVGLDYILNTFIETMKRSGITKTQIEKISRQNCIRALTC